MKTGLRLLSILLLIILTFNQHYCAKGTKNFLKKRLKIWLKMQILIMKKKTFMDALDQVHTAL